jgi:hypothetical protein
MVVENRRTSGDNETELRLTCKPKVVSAFD